MRSEVRIPTASGPPKGGVKSSGGKGQWRVPGVDMGVVCHSTVSLGKDKTACTQ